MCVFFYDAEFIEGVKYFEQRKVLQEIPGV